MKNAMTTTKKTLATLAVTAVCAGGFGTAAARSAAAEPAPTPATSTATPGPTSTRNNGVTDAQVKKFDRYVTQKADGTFEAKIPAATRAADPAGTQKVTGAVAQANKIAGEQGAKPGPGGVSKPLPAGEHATFQAAWWGTIWTLDKTAADQLAGAIDSGKDVGDVVKGIFGLELGIDPIVAPIVKIVIGFVEKAGAGTKKNITDDGLVIKTLWLPIAWSEKPTGPFVPAPAN